MPQANFYDVWNGSYCPHCGGPIFSAPREKLDAPTGRKLGYDELDGLKYSGPKSTKKKRRKNEH
jgi:hypothetical protein